MDAKHYIALTSLLLGILQTSFGLKCLHCDSITHPRYCQVVTTCNPGEVCYAKTVEAADGYKSYRLGCTYGSSQSVCNNTVSATDSFHCSECCRSDLCNSGLCGQIGYPAQRGPICYSCRSRLVTEPCNAIQFCGTDEVCSFSQSVMFSDHVYSSGCSQKHKILSACQTDWILMSCAELLGASSGSKLFAKICEAHNHGYNPHIIGKRAIHGHEQAGHASDSEDDLAPGSCHSCCDTDLCNTNCSIIDAVKECQSQPCHNGGTCVDTHSGHTCLCLSGYTDLNCDIAVVKECQSVPCRNGGTCMDINNGHMCVCQSGFAGLNCEIDIDECASYPCSNGATCVNTIGRYTCICPPGFTGASCEAGIDECASYPCRNGATCVNTINRYTCICPPGFTGASCDRDIDDCASSPCHNGATCIDGIDSYSCNCSPGYTGGSCDTAPVHDCLDVQKQGLGNSSGVYTITLLNTTLRVLCDMKTDGGGWTVFQYRYDGSVRFNRSFSSYEKGFGDVNGEFWLGLKNIYELARNCSHVELRIDLENSRGTRTYQKFNRFYLTRGPDYTLHLGTVSGPLGESYGIKLNEGYNFRTYDRDIHDCAKQDHGGWWYSYCAYANLNGEYMKPPGTKSLGNAGETGMTYYSFDLYRSLKVSKMSLRKNNC